jgi:hypothetical protein
MHRIGDRRHVRHLYSIHCDVQLIIEAERYAGLDYYVFSLFLSSKLMHYDKLPLKTSAYIIYTQTCRPFWIIVRNCFGFSILGLNLLNSVCFSGSSHVHAFPEIVTKSGNSTLSTRLVRSFFFSASICILAHFEKEKLKNTNNNDS